MGKGKSIAGLVLGIASLVICWIPVWGAIPSLPLAVVGLVLSILGGKAAKANGQKSGLATAGLVVGIIATVLSAICFLSCGLCVICVAASV